MESDTPQESGFPLEPNRKESHAEAQVTTLSGMYENYFLDYASYVILERAVPALEDGLKPVQRRILHSMWELEDGRYNKVANIVGNTMKYHPHGDASITEAIVQLGQRDLLIDTQGNWGNIFTGDSAAAPRYIEARLTRLALEAVFHPRLTEWQASYDGRNKEPVTLPVRFPLLLAQGVEGIAVGLSCKILPHNFAELCEACIHVLQGKPFQLYPDFPTGGLADCSKYNDGKRGGRVRVRARINIIDHKTLSITEIPFGTTTESLIDSIVAAGEKGKIKVRKIEDNTAEKVEIILHLGPGATPDTTIEALYAFTDCEVTISPNACVIYNGKPVFLGVSDIVRYNAERTRELLEKDLQLRLAELRENHLFASLEKIFIEKRIYRRIEECDTWEAVLDAIEEGLRPYMSLFYRPVTREDMARLTEIRIKRISRYDVLKAEENLAALERSIAETQENLGRINQYTIQWFKKLLKEFGKNQPRLTEITEFDTVALKKIVHRNEKLYYDPESGFLGYGMRTGNFVCDCSDIDDVLVFSPEGSFTLTRVEEKKFVGKNALHICLWERDKEMVFHMIFRDGRQGPYIVKRFRLGGITRDKRYDLTRGTPGSQVVYFTAHDPGVSEVLTIHLKPKPRLKKLVFDLDMDKVPIRGRDSQGVILTRLPIRKIVRKSTLQAAPRERPLWFDEHTRRFSFTEKGRLIGYIQPGQRVFVVNRNGTARWIVPDLTTFFEDIPFAILPCPPQTVVTFVYRLKATGEYFVKRFVPESEDKFINLVGEEDADPVFVTIHPEPVAHITYFFGRQRERRTETISLSTGFPIKGEMARGARLFQKPISEVRFEEPPSNSSAESPNLSALMSPLSTCETIFIQGPDTLPELSLGLD